MRKDIVMLRALLATHTCAMAFAMAVSEVEDAKADLDDAYRQWKIRHSLDFVEKNSAAWQAMMLATEAHYRALLNAKARKRRAEKKLLQAVEG